MLSSSFFSRTRSAPTRILSIFGINLFVLAASSSNLSGTCSNSTVNASASSSACASVVSSGAFANWMYNGIVVYVHSLNLNT
ncbi:secreted protein [marine sediment metagenome]|uniref:Secreted protein n=1 Tax=marine sediment metagenome TaxID=412755 RepID=A0A1B6NRF1_9ZZZZ